MLIESIFAILSLLSLFYLDVLSCFCEAIAQDEPLLSSCSKSAEEEYVVTAPVVGDW